MVESKERSALSLYYGDVGEFSLLTREEEKALGLQVQKGGGKAKEAIRKLIQSNLRLVVKIAQDFQGRGLDIEDLISEGNLGLTTAAKKFNPLMGAKFSYYSSFWIKQNILRAISNHGRLIRIPVCTLDKYYKIVNFVNKHKKETDQPPSNAVIAKEFKITVKRLMQILEAVDVVMPLDAKLGVDGDTRIHEIISDEINISPDKSIAQKDDNELLRKLVKKLRKREQFIIENRFDLNGDGKKTLEVLGQKLKITRERVRQIEMAALIKLKSFLVNSNYEIIL